MADFFFKKAERTCSFIREFRVDTTLCQRYEYQIHLPFLFQRGHSVKVPRLYKVATSILKSFKNGEGSVKTLVYDAKAKKKHPNVKALFALGRSWLLKFFLFEAKLKFFTFFSLSM